MSEEPERLRQRIAELESENECLRKALRQSEEWFRKIFHASSNMMAIHTMHEGLFVDVNEAAASMGGFTREELIGRSIRDGGLIDDPEMDALVSRKLREEGRAHNLPLKVRTKTGDMRSVLFSADPITVNDEPCRLAVSVDITEQEERADALRRSEEALKESREYLHQIINRIGDPIFVKDREHRFVLVNDAVCDFRGRPREDIIGCIDEAHYMGTPFWEQEEEVLRTGKENISEDNIPDGRGILRTLLTKKSLLTGKDGSKQVVGVQRDITDYKRLEAQFLQSQKMEAIGVLAGGVAHDFNNLLNVINGYAELMLNDMAPDHPLRHEIEQIRDAGQRAAVLTSQLLAFSRKQIMQPEILDLNKVITQMEAMLRRLIGEDIEFVPVTRPNLGFVNADRGKCEQIIMNLVVNARDAMPQGGKLTIETDNIDFDDSSIRDHPLAQRGSYVMLAISDNGIGMDAATQSHLFEPFFTTKSKGKGTGLGLSTVYGIVKQSNGFIWTYSEPGKGTTFKIYLPRVQSAAADTTVEASAPSGIEGVETILVVEDEESVRALACRILRNCGYTVLDAQDGIEALRLAEEYSGRIHMVVSDVIMPKMSGKDLVLRIEALRPGIKSLFISGYTDNSIVHHGILDSNVAFLQKPFSADSLCHKVRQVLQT